MGLLLLDLDGTIVESSLEEVDGKLGPAPGLFTEPRLRPNVYDVLNRAALEGDRFAIVTNQGGVAWGYATEQEVHARISRAVALLDGFWGRPFSVHVCFAHERATVKRYRDGHERRKPSGAMLNEAIEAHLALGLGDDLAMAPYGSLSVEILMVGDLEADKEAAAAASVDFAPAGDFFTW